MKKDKISARIQEKPCQFGDIQMLSHSGAQNTNSCVLSRPHFDELQIYTRFPQTRSPEAEHLHNAQFPAWGTIPLNPWMTTQGAVSPAKKVLSPVHMQHPMQMLQPVHMQMLQNVHPRHYLSPTNQFPDYHHINVSEIPVTCQLTTFTPDEFCQTRMSHDDYHWTPPSAHVPVSGAAFPEHYLTPSTGSPTQSPGQCSSPLSAQSD